MSIMTEMAQRKQPVYHGSIHTEDICIAIVRQAAKDYRSAAEEYRRAATEKRRNEARSKIDALERFFRSGWGQLLCNGHGEYILNRLKAEENNA